MKRWVTPPYAIGSARGGLRDKDRATVRGGRQPHPPPPYEFTPRRERAEHVAAHDRAPIPSIMSEITCGSPDGPGGADPPVPAAKRVAADTEGLLSHLVGPATLRTVAQRSTSKDSLVKGLRWGGRILWVVRQTAAAGENDREGWGGMEYPT